MSLQRITCEQASGETLIHACDPCGRELGRVRGVVLFDGSLEEEYRTFIANLISGQEQQLTTAVTWFENVITQGKAHLISETTGTEDGGAAQTGDGYGDEETRLLGYLHTLTFKDPSYAGNKDFWQQAELNHWLIAWRTETLLHFADKPAGLQVTDPTEQELTSAVVWNITATWKSKNHPDLAPIEPLKKYFEGCWDVAQNNPSGN